MPIPALTVLSVQSTVGPPSLHPTLGSSHLNGALLCKESWNILVYIPFNFSYTAKVPFVHRAPGYPHLHPLHFQLSWQGTFCVESPGTIAAHVYFNLVILAWHPLHGELWGLQAYTHFNFSCPAMVVSAWRAPGLPSLHTALALATLLESTEHLRTP